jgi:hypothetical protein
MNFSRPKNILKASLRGIGTTLYRMGSGISHNDKINWDRRRPAVSGLKGEIFAELRNPDGSLLSKYHIKNIITLDMSILVARLLRDNGEPLHGLFMLAVGTGDVGWDPMNPPAATNTQRSLYAEIARKPFSSVNFIDSVGAPSLIPTNVVDFTTTFSESEAVGPLVEMGLLGGDVNGNPLVLNPILPPNGPFNAAQDVVGLDQLCNYLTFPVINKPATATLTLTWRITT